MSAEPDNQPVLLRFFDSFLQERNIKWLLALGMLILLASSVMLVTTHWDEAGYTPVWKYLTLLGYAAGIYAASQWAYHYACLRKTGTGLMALTVLLAPLTFLALRWVQTDQSHGFFEPSINLGLLALNLALVLYAVRRIFHHFLRGPQHTFTASFVGLCLAGAFLPGIPWGDYPALAGGVALLLWALFAAGTSKVNRHVFWLTELRQTPRIFGFFPMLLLGAQFLLLFVLNFAGHIELQWIGLGCVLTAFPILLATDQIVAVFQHRTGNLVRPLPWSIVLPFGAGLLLTVVGVCLAGLGLRPPHVVPLALAPTAALAAVALGLVARRTGHRAFVWGMLVLVALAYNFSYAFFREAAQAVLTQGAMAVRESRLPLAFYGLTYLPLLCGLTGAAVFAARRGQTLFAKPMQSFCVALQAVLLVLACTHATAMFPVGLVLLGLSAVQAMLFRDRRLVYFAICAWFVGAFGVVPFGEHVWELTLPEDLQLVVLALASGLLLLPGAILDRAVRKLPGSPASNQPLSLLLTQAPCELFSLASSVLLALAGFGWFTVSGGSPALWSAAGLLIGAQFAHSLRRSELGLGPMVYGFAVTSGLCFAHSLQTVSVSTMVSLSAWMLLVQWCASYILAARREWRVREVYLPTLQISSLVGLVAGFFTLSLAPMFVEACRLPASLVTLESGLALRLLLIVWIFDAARRYAHPLFTVLGTVAVFVAVSALLVATHVAKAYVWLPFAWSVLAVVGLFAVQYWQAKLAKQFDPETAERSRRKYATFIRPLSLLLPSVLTFIGVASLPLLAWPVRMAAAVSLAGLLGHVWLRGNHTLRTVCLALLHWQAIMALAAWVCPAAKNIVELFVDYPYPLALPLALASSVSLLVWQQLPRGATQRAAEVGDIQRRFLRVAIVAGLGWSLFAPVLTLPYALTAGVTFGLLALAELVEACQKKKERFVWGAELVVLLGVGYFANFGWLVFGHGWAMFVVLLLGITAYVVSLVARCYSTTAILSRPLALTGFWLPLVSVFIGVGRHFLYTQPQWLGMNSLALLFVAGFYFYQAIERRQTRLWILSGGVLNLALLLLWSELKLTDPQFYLIPIGISVLGLVQLLKQEIPAKFHDPLRYCGALVILVSPTFHILGGSWLHMVTLLVAAVSIVLVSIGLRIRALMYTGTAFLLADLVAMIVQGSIVYPNLLWIAGLGVGAAVVAFGAFCENHRGQIEQRLRILSATLKQWD